MYRFFFSRVCRKRSRFGRIQLFPLWNDAQGRKLYDLEKNSSSFNLKLQKGVYFIELISENSRYIEKIVVN
ncbi:MAG: T9SS type A sorting domain-containing protein [Flavobacteriia bacterium]|nr:T9SS type A sorting domain-containing protein [Flavobacteriia bacterium]